MDLDKGHLQVAVLDGKGKVLKNSRIYNLFVTFALIAMAYKHIDYQLVSISHLCFIGGQLIIRRWLGLLGFIEITDITTILVSLLLPCHLSNHSIESQHVMEKIYPKRKIQRSKDILRITYNMYNCR
jgi:hypothetical protein